MAKAISTTTLHQEIATRATRVAYDFACGCKRKDGTTEYFVGFQNNLHEIGIINKPGLPSMMAQYLADVKITFKDGLPVNVVVDRVITAAEYSAEEKEIRMRGALVDVK